MANDDGLGRQSGAVTACTALAVLSGFALDVLIVARFGIGAQTDAFFAAYTIPLILITCTAALQPVLVSLLAAGLPQSGRVIGQGGTTTADYALPAATAMPGDALFSTLFNAGSLLALALSAAGTLAAGSLLRLTAPGFTPSTAALAVPLARLLFLRVPGAAMAEVLKAALYARRRFTLPALSNAAPSLAAIALLWALPGAPIAAVAAGLVLGTLAQVALLAWLLFGQQPCPYTWRLRWPGRDLPVLRQIGSLVMAPLAGLLLRQGVTVAERILGSFLPAGSLTALSYANRLTMVAAGVFFDSLTTVSLPALAAAWAQGADEAARAVQRRLLRLTCVVALPLGLAVAALSAPLVRVFFQRGQVDAGSAQLLAAVLAVYALSLPALGPYRAVQAFFYAVNRPRPIIALHGILTGLTIALDLALVRFLGAVGLAAAFVLSCAVTLALGLLWLSRRAGDSLHRRADSAWRLGLASIVMAAVLFGSSRTLDVALAGASRWSQAAALGVCALLGLAVFGAMGAVLRVGEVTGVWQMVRSRWRHQER